MILSDKLIHFPDYDPRPIAEKAAERARLQSQVEEYLSRGGQIHQLGNESGIQFRLDRTRQEMINEQRRRSWNRTQR